MNTAAIDLSRDVPSAPASAPVKPFSHWVRSPVFDAATTLSGISFCLLLLCLRPFHLDIRFALILFAYDRGLAMMHSWSTTYMVVGSKMFKPLRDQNRDRYLTIPVLIFLASIALGILIAKTVNIADTGEVEWGSALYYFPYIGLFWLGHFWHFGRQDFGVLSLYRSRAGQTAVNDRRIDNLFSQAMMYVIQPIAYFAAFTRGPATMLFNWLTGLQLYTEKLATIAAYSAILLFCAVMVLELRRSNRSAGKMLYYCVMLFHPAFLFFANADMFVYWHVVYLWSHWLIAIALSARIGVGHDERVNSGKKLWKIMARHFLIVGGASAAIYMLFTPFAGLSLLDGDFLDAREHLRTLVPGRFLLVGVYFGFGLGEQLVHYYCDRCLFRFKNPEVRALIAPHLQ